ncbi:GIY-YIG nuclease family protein [Sandarakinorhabdus sp.]|uniref:GIY-YIG nuclease family protein n=1 Tax=Sandarakinorhabdus sp. TaxID=1916663 RepID=UPI00286E91DB|nr:GIY-YIG nuclease family protein [Sandarakinorhabdus sp.]
MEKGGHVYILASRRQGTLYIGVTADLMRRVSEHRLGETPGFTRRYGANRLVWHEAHGEITSAIAREKQLKHWNRAWKIRLIETANPEWRDLAVSDLGFPPHAALSGDGPPPSRG